MLEETASSLAELIGKTKLIARGWVPSENEPEELWFRGQPNARNGLLPGLYRNSEENITYDEVDLFERFKSLATPYMTRVPSDDWEWYFLAQHFGLPTRLLDWTEGLLAAAYFALCNLILSQTRVGVDRKIGEGRLDPIFDEDSPTVWILDAGTLNNSMHGLDMLFVPSVDGKLAPYLPEWVSDHRSRRNRLPIAILPPKANERITAQQGMFTVHGHSTSSLDALAESPLCKSPIHLARIRLDRANACHIWAELQLAGVHQLTIFPDVGHAALHAKWIMQVDGHARLPPDGKEPAMLSRRRTPKKSARKAKKGGKKKSAKKR